VSHEVWKVSKVSVPVYHQIEKKGVGLREVSSPIDAGPSGRVVVCPTFCYLTNIQQNEVVCYNFAGWICGQ